MPKSAESVWDLDRNDLEGAIEYIRTHEVSGDEMRTLLLLQDDSGDALRARMRELGIKRRGVRTS